MSVTTRKSTVRSGVSLLEILISIGVLSVGLLGVISLIPAGQFALMKTTKADRSTACAKAAKVRAEIDGMIDPDQWMHWNTDTGDWETYEFNIYDPNYYTNPLTQPNIVGSTIVFDPFFIAYAIADNQIVPAANFPMNAASATHPIPPTVPNFLYLNRYTTDNLHDASIDFTPEEGIALCERIFRWADDANIDIDDTNPDLRPRQVFHSDEPAPEDDEKNNFGPSPYRPTDDDPITGNMLRRAIKGDYSWFLTITPDPAEIFSPIDQMKSYEVAVVVCYKREFTVDPGAVIPTERLATVGPSFAGISGMGANDIPLQLPDPSNFAGDSTEEIEYLRPKSDQWIMLVGQVRDSRLDYDPGTGLVFGFRTIAKWYRVLSADDEIDDNDNLWVTVTGPEWRTPEDPANPVPGEIQNTQAILVDDVIGVFTETMSVDR